MGTFAGLYRGKDAAVPDDRIEEFEIRLLKLFRAAGMFEMKYMRLYGYDIFLLAEPSMHSYGMDFTYNYFEDAGWENAGYSKKKRSVYSDKIGSDQFHMGVAAGYVLQALYTDGAAAPEVNGRFISTEGYTGWINYLFDECFSVRSSDPWDIYENTFLDSEYDGPDMERWLDLVALQHGGLDGFYEVYAVKEGVDAAAEHINTLLDFGKKREENAAEGNEKLNPYELMTNLKGDLERYKSKCGRSADEQLAFIMDLLRDYYMNGPLGNAADEKIRDNLLKWIYMEFILIDAPAFIVRVLSEVYEQDFRKLWAQVSDIAHKRIRNVYEKTRPPAARLTTFDVFGAGPDDMIFYWEEGGKIDFSDELKSWFADLSGRYFELLSADWEIENPLRWVVELVKYVNRVFYKIYPFYDFFEESLNNLSDRRYLALWKLCEELAYDEELKEAAQVIFLPTDYKSSRISDYSDEDGRRLAGSCDLIPDTERFNKGRVTLRRYMALVGNKKLREKVFGV